MITGNNNLYDKILEYIYKNPEGVSSSELVKTFMNCGSPGHSIADRLINNLMKDDKRCNAGKDGRWRVSHLDKNPEELPLDKSSTAAVFVLSVSAQGRYRPANISIWETGCGSGMICSRWLVNPYSLPPDESNILIHKNDSEFTEEHPEKAVEKITECLKDRTLFFLSAEQQNSFNNLLFKHGFFPVEETILISTLFRASNIKISKPIRLDNCFKKLFNMEPHTTSALSYGEKLSEITRELINRAANNNIHTKTDIDKLNDTSSLPVDWSKKAFNKNDLSEIPSCPGVYGFKDFSNNFFYVGKSTNLKRRISGYFRCSPDSPEKYHKIKDNSYSFTIHKCGSELEALLYEYRLIKKYNPVLNSQSDINERKGTFFPIQDSIIILPHAENSKRLLLWFRRGKKIRLQPLSVNTSAHNQLKKEIGDFFYSKELPVSKTDFPEYEIAFRWIKRRKDRLNIIPVDRMSSAGEIIASIMTSLNSI